MRKERNKESYNLTFQNSEYNCRVLHFINLLTCFGRVYPPKTISACIDYSAS